MLIIFAFSMDRSKRDPISSVSDDDGNVPMYMGVRCEGFLC